MKSIKVTVLGKQYPLKIKEGDEDMMYQIAEYVDKRFHAFRKALPNQSESTIMVLASLSITEELFFQNDEMKPIDERDPRSVFSEINESLREIVDDIEYKNDDL